MFGRTKPRSYAAADSWYVIVMLWRLELFVKHKVVDCVHSYKLLISIELLTFTRRAALRQNRRRLAASCRIWGIYSSIRKAIITVSSPGF